MSEHKENQENHQKQEDGLFDVQDVRHPKKDSALFKALRKCEY